jgi:hypothetical protein
VNNDDRLNELLAGYVAQSLTEADEQELIELLEKSEEAKAALGEHLVLDRLARQLAQPSVNVDAVMSALPSRARPSLSSRVMKSLAQDDQKRAAASSATSGERKSMRRARRHRMHMPSASRNVWLFLAATAAAAACVVLFVVPALQKPSSPVAIAHIVHGAPRAALIRQQTQVTPADGADVFAGDELRVPADATVTVAYPDSTRVTLGEAGVPTDGDAVRLAASVVFDTAKSGARLFHKAGLLAADVSKQPAGKPMVIRTPHAMATIVGTRFTLAVKTDMTRLDVTEGIVRLSRHDGSGSLDVAAVGAAMAYADGKLAMADRQPKTFTPVVRYFDKASPWNTPVPANAAIDLNSTAMVAKLSENIICNLYDYAVPIYEADANTPVRKVACTRHGNASPFVGMEVRVPDGARPNVGNGWMVVIDQHARRTWEFWHFTWSGQDVVSVWGGTMRLDGNAADGLYAGAAGGSLLAGTIRLGEIESGAIGHAIAFGTCYAKKGEFRYPSRYPDGVYTGPDAIPTGTRIQLDPALDVAAIPGITRAELAIARALQQHGGFCLGETKAPMGLFFELAPDAVDAQHPGSVYAAAGLRGIRDQLPHIPWKSLRVLSQSDGR